MGAVVKSLALAVGQLGDPAVLRVLGKSAAVTLALFAALGFALFRASLYAASLLGLGFQSEMAFLATVILVALAGWFLFRLVAIAILQFFADEVVMAVERRHYPAAASRARKLPFREDMKNSLRGAGRALLFNALALPVAAILLFTAIGPAVVFLAVNAVLLGRELTDMAWLRHRAECEAMAPVDRIERILLGASIAAIMLVPFANLLAPVIGAAAGTHLFHISKGRQANA